MAPLAYYVHRIDPFVVRFNDSIGIRWYGVAYLAGFAVAALLLRAYARAGRSQLPSSRIGDLMFYVIAGVLAGGKLGYFLLYQPGLLRADPLALLRFWEGGMSSHGGIIGVIVALVLFARVNRLSFLHLGDLVVSAAPAGLFFGRVANFINGELWGRISVVKWAVIFPGSAPPGTPVTAIDPRHPSQLYEAGLEGVLLLALMQWRFWRSDVVRTQPGRLSGEFFIAYTIVRAIGEQFREPDASLILGLTRGTFYSLFLAIAGAALIAKGVIRRKS